MPIKAMTIGAIFAISNWGSPAFAQDTAAWPPFRDMHLRNACRLASQVLTKGQPANHTEWALGVLPRCGPLAGQVVVERLRNTQSTQSARDSLKLLIGVTWGLQDAALFDGAVAVAQDPAAPEFARVEALRVLHGILLPGQYVSYEAMTGHSLEWTDSFDEPVYHGDPLPSNYLARLTDVTDRIGQDSATPTDVRTAAQGVAGAARACARRGTCGQ
jgi:hypothetical protein